MADIQTQLPVKGSLTNNNAAPTTNNVGVLPVLANAAAPSWTEGNQVLLSSDLSGNLRVLATSTGTGNVNLTQVGGAAIALGQTTMSASLPVVLASDQSNIVVVGTKTNNSAAPGANNFGALPAVATTAAPTYTTGNQVALSTDTAGSLRVTTVGTNAVNLTQVGGSAIALGQTTMVSSLPVVIASNQSTLTVSGSGNFNVVGTLTHNNAAPAANNVGALTARANAAAPTWTEGNQVLLSSDLAGNLRVSATLSGTSAVNVTQVGGSAISLGQKTMANSLPVVIASDQSTLPVTAGEVTSGIVAYYQTVSAVANGSTGTITYTVTAGKTLYLKQIMGSSSGGPCRVQVDYGAGPTIICVSFYSTASPYFAMTFAQPIAIVAGTAVNIKILNSVGVAQDVYGFIGGHEI